jgi:hypothetical protein
MRNCQVLLGITILGTALVGACSNGGAGTQASGGAGGSSSSVSGTGGENGTGGISNSGGATATQVTLDPNGDDDGDGLSNAVELALSLDPQSADSDNDGIDDLTEVGPSATAPLDSDGDGIIDALESSLMDNDLDGTPDPNDPAQGWQLASCRFRPAVIANDGLDKTTVEVRLTKTAGITRVAVWTLRDYASAMEIPDELRVDGTALGTGEIELYDDGTHGDRFAKDGVYSRGNLSTTMAIRSDDKTRGILAFNTIVVTDGNGRREVRPTASNDQGNRVMKGRSFLLGVVDKAAVAVPKRIRDDVQKTPHFMNIAQAPLALRVRRALVYNPGVSTTGDQTLAKAVLDLIPGDVDFVVTFPEATVNGGLAGYYGSAHNEVQGIGLDPFGYLPGWGVEGKIFKGILTLNFDLYQPANHELVHQWAVYLSEDFGFGQGASGHWGYAGTYGVLGGFDPATLVDNGDGTFNVGSFSLAGNNWMKTPLSSIELYLVGLAPPSEVKPIPVIMGAQTLSTTDTAVVIKGTLKTITIDDIIAKHGARVPDSSQAQKAFTAAFAVFSERLLTPSEMAWFDAYADLWSRTTMPGSLSFAEAMGGRATIKTILPVLVGE